MSARINGRGRLVAGSTTHGQIVSQDLRIDKVAAAERNSIVLGKNHANTSGILKQKIGSTPDGPI